MVPHMRFSTPKPSRLIAKVQVAAMSQSDLLLDFFAGSGATGQAVINLNREDGGSRKYILVEMGKYFHTILKPRVLKSAYSSAWKGGKPASRDSVSQIVKVLTLESYEDTLNNLELRRPPETDALLGADPAVREGYLLSYMLDFETHNSPSLLNTAAFAHPFDYRLNIARGGESVPTTVDLVETFNYLLGLRVDRVRIADGFCAVEGRDPAGDPVLVLWRTVSGDPAADGDALARFFRAGGYHERPDDQSFARVYVNGDANKGHLLPADHPGQFLLTEEEFSRLMFATPEV